MNITVYGLGYVGVVGAAHMSSLGNHVSGVEPKEEKVNQLNGGIMPFFEPHLSSMWNDQPRSINLYTANEDMLDIGDVSIVCVGTPLIEGRLCLKAIARVMEQITTHETYSRHHTIIIRSTLPPGTCNSILSVYKEAPQLIFMPEFLREGSAIHDIQNPSLLCFATNFDFDDAKRVIGLCMGYDTTEARVSSNFTDIEMVKLVCNTWHATKITFTNEVSRLCQAIGADSRQVMGTFCDDKTLNISKQYLRPGFSYGGSCLPKDVAQICDMFENRTDTSAPMITSLDGSNGQHTQFTCDRIEKLCHAKGFLDIYILGAAFKSHTDDLRNSEVVNLIYKLLAVQHVHQYKLHIVDPFVDFNSGEFQEISDNYTSDSISFYHVDDVLLPHKLESCRDKLVVVTQEHTSYSKLYKSIKYGVVLDLFNMEAGYAELMKKRDAVEYQGLSW